jgi:hypothetical protein
MVALVAAWVLTLLIEWPFMALCFRGASGWLRRSVMATLAIQTVSCLVVGGFLMKASYYSLLTEHRIVASEELPWPPGLVVYYIDPDGRSIRSFDTDAGESAVVHRMGDRQKSELSAVYFSAEPTEEGTSIHQLLVGSIWGSFAEQAKAEELGVWVDASSIVRVRKVQEPDDRPLYPFGADWHPYSPSGGPVSINKPPPEVRGIWQGFWAAQGLEYTIGDEEKSRSFQLSIETPYANWGVRQTMHLGDGILIFVLGTDQICLLDMRTQRVALKMRGFGPIAVPKEAVVEEGAAAP